MLALTLGQSVGPYPWSKCWPLPLVKVLALTLGQSVGLTLGQSVALTLGQSVALTLGQSVLYKKCELSDSYNIFGVLYNSKIQSCQYIKGITF